MASSLTSVPPAWNVKYDKLQVQGLGAAGGWTDVVYVERRQTEVSPGLAALAAALSR
jgi:hypothetical protein